MLPMVPSEFSFNKWEGNVPRLPRELEEAVSLPKEKKGVLAILQSPVLTAQGVVRGLGFARDEENAWISYISCSVLNANNALDLLRDISAKATSDGVDPFIRNVLGIRALSYYKNFNKSSYKIDLRKAEARGGKYYRRVLGPSGKYTYFYDEDSYHRSKNSHESGDRAIINYLTNKVKNILITNGNRVDIKMLGPLVKRYGIEKVEKILTDGTKKGNIVIEKGKLSWKGA